jgi:RimJ/RimL family protein N-acetyltransferase
MDSFTTPRLIATRLAASDLDELTALHLDPEVSRYLGGVRTPDVTAAYMEANLHHWAEHGIGVWTLRTNDGAYAGRGGLRYLDMGDVLELEIGYSFAKAFWGQGLAIEIARALVDIWETRPADRSLVGIVVKENRASERVLEKVGLAYESDTIQHGQNCGVFRRWRAGQHGQPARL